MKERILFVKARGIHKEFNTISPPLGILILANIARDQLGKEIRFIDTHLHKRHVQTFVCALREFQPAIVAISALTAESESMHILADLTKKHCPDAFVIAGGPHPTAYPDDTLQNNNIDIAVINEGEVTFAEILRRLDAGAPVSDVAGIALRGTDNQLVFTRQRAFISELDQIPFPAFDLVDFDAYARRTAFTPVRRRRYMNLMTSRGCPFRCTYCHSIQGKKFRAHSPAYVLNMLQHLIHGYGIRHFEFIDDIFNWDRIRLHEIMTKIIENKLDIKFSFPNALRGDRLEPEQVRLMADAGLEFTAIAVESANPERQKQMRKFLDIEHVGRTIEDLANRSVFTCGFFMLGFPGETKAEMKKTVDFALRSRLHLAYFLTVTPFQGTEIHKQAMNAQLVTNGNQIYGDQYVDQKVNLSALSDAEFFWLKKIAYFRFYANPFRIFRILKVIPSKISLFIRFSGLLKILLMRRAGNHPIRLFRKKLQQLINRTATEEADVNVHYREARQRNEATRQRRVNP